MAIVVFPLDPSAGAPAYAAQAFRQVMSALCVGGQAGRPLGTISGVSPGTPRGTITVSGLTVTVRTHSGILDVETSAGAGPYFYAVSASQVFTLGAASGSNPRIDLVSVQVSDPTQDSSTTPGGAIVITQGTPSATPVTPTTPAGALTLATIAVPQSGTGSPVATWVAPYTAAAGGVLPVANSGQYPTAPYEGQYVDDASLNQLLRYDGTQWGMPNETGWVAAGLASSFVTYTGPAPAVWRSGNLVVVRGLINPTSGYTTSHTYSGAVTLPPGFCPGGVGKNVIGATNGVDRTVRLDVTTAGVVTINTGAIAPNFVDLSALSGFIAEN